MRALKRPAATEFRAAPPSKPPTEPRSSRTPLQWGYLVTLGAIGAVATGFALYGLRSILFMIFFAAFATVGIDPLIRWFQRHHFSRAWAIVTVILLILGVVVAIVWVVVPLVVSQITFLVQAIPKEVAALRAQGWFDSANETSNGLLGNVVNWIVKEVKDPKVWATIGTGVLGFGAALIDAFTSGFFVLILTIYFIASYDGTKNAAYKLVSASHRGTFIEYAERILRNFGKYLSGMVILAFINAVYSTILLVVTGVPGAFLIGIAAFFITLIPLIGTVLTTIAMTVIALIHAPISALIVLIFMLVYMQVEAYILTPKVMGKAVQIPGSVVLISALGGATLFGLAGALVAIPISAGVILIIKELVMPRKELQ